MNTSNSFASLIASLLKRSGAESPGLCSPSPKSSLYSLRPPETPQHLERRRRRHERRKQKALKRRQQLGQGTRAKSSEGHTSDPSSDISESHRDVAVNENIVGDCEHANGRDVDSRRFLVSELKNATLFRSVICSRRFAPYLNDFLRFITGRPGLLGFTDSSDSSTDATTSVQPPLVRVQFKPDSSSLLPTAMTCFQTIILSSMPYDSREALFSHLVTCAKYCSSFGFK